MSKITQSNINELAFTTRLTREDVAGLIEAMAESLKEGVVKVQKSNTHLEFNVPRVIDLEVRATRDEESSSVIFEVSWRNKPIEVPEEPEHGEPEHGKSEHGNPEYDEPGRGEPGYTDENNYEDDDK